MLNGLLAFSLLMAILSGCGRGEPRAPAHLSMALHASGNHQAAMHGAMLAKPFRVIVESARVPGMLGGKGRRRAIRGETVHFEVIRPANGGVFESTGTENCDVATDAGGMATARLRLGELSGDVLISASLPAYPAIEPLQFRALAGGERIGKDLEAATGGTIDEFGVRLVNPDGSPARGVEVSFRTEGNGAGASVEHERSVTGPDGRAVTSWTLGEKTQQYYASVAIRDARLNIPPASRFDANAIEFKAMAINKREMLVVLFGGLAVFILGMKLMSEGLQRMADRRLKSVLHFMTQNRFMAVLAGAFITAMIQASSATTVMTVGFVNAGLITLAESIGVIFGANIGTTITAQIIAFKLDALAYPAIALGLIMAGLLKQPRFKALGQAILGFGLLFLGMTTMSGILKPLRYSPEFVAWFKIFECAPQDGGFVAPGAAVMCILIGTVMTCVIQSSSATVGLVMALASQGLISFYTAVPLILGDNIGTTITANLAAIGANRNARRAALAHSIFNVFGAMYMYLLLFVPIWGGQPLFLGFVDWITPGEIFNDHPENLLRHVANAHSAFNILNVLLFLPFLNTMARLCQRIIPMTEEDRDTVLHYLEPKLLASPPIALAQAVKEVQYMISKGQNSMNESCDLFCDKRKELAPKILEREKLIDRLQQEITDYLVRLSRANLSHNESALIPALIHAVNDAERLGDHAEDLVELYQLMKDEKLKVSKRALRGIREFQEGLNKQFEVIQHIFDVGDGAASQEAYQVHRELQAKAKELTDLHVKRLDAGKCEVRAGVIYLDALSHLERVGDHLINIVDRAGKISEVTAG